MVPITPSLRLSEKNIYPAERRRKAKFRFGPVTSPNLSPQLSREKKKKGFEVPGNILPGPRAQLSSELTKSGKMQTKHGGCSLPQQGCSIKKQKGRRGTRGRARWWSLPCFALGHSDGHWPPRRRMGKQHDTSSSQLSLRVPTGP